MKNLKVLILLITIFIIDGCNSPPLYQTRAREFLASQGVNASVIKKLADRQPLEPGEVDLLMEFDNIPTLHLLASNPSVPVSTLEQLAQHSNEEVRWGVAANKNTPLGILLQLRTEREYSTMNTYLAQNPKIPQDVLLTMYRNGEASDTSFALNENCPLQLMEVLATEGSEGARIWLAINPNITEDIISILEKDESNKVRAYLSRNPNKKILPADGDSAHVY